MSAIIKFLKTQGTTINRTYYEKIEFWKAWYRGRVNSFHKYCVFNGTKNIERERYSLGMPKKAAEDWANLLLNERVTISTDKEKFNDTLEAILERNKFLSRGNQLLEKAFALGTGALVEWLDENEEVVIDYITADMIYPLSSDNGEIVDCAFASERIANGKTRYYIQVHKRNEDKAAYTVANFIIDDKGEPVSLPENVLEVIDVPRKMFQIIKPNIVNNEDMSQPLGISIFANALDANKVVDVAFDSLANDFVIGRGRVLVPAKYATIQQVADGSKRPVFDPSDTFFYIYEGQTEGSKIEFVQPKIRTDDHVKALDNALARFADKCGLGADRYKYEDSGAQTATGIISEKSELYQNVRKHELLLRDALVEMVRAIAALEEVQVAEVNIDFDDSIIEDQAARKAQFLSEINTGVRAPWEYRVAFMGETDEVAKKTISEISGNGGVTE
ncbi:Phage portal protein, SPP1 Gp6-like [Gammaproteobacteria bacterium]